MPARFRKKVRRLRGSRTHGWGAKKKHRGGGSQAGKGRAGMMKQRKSWMLQHEPHHFGRIGFKIPPEAKRRPTTITLRDLDVLARALGKKELDVGELGFQKVLGTGRLTQPLSVKAKVIVGRAKQKITEAGGTAVETAPFRKEAENV